MVGAVEPSGMAVAFPTTGIQRGRLVTMMLAHFCVDSYSTMLAPLLPLRKMVFVLPLVGMLT